MTRATILRIVAHDAMASFIEAFLDDCQLADLSPRTIDNYRSTLANYRWWCMETGAGDDPTLHTPATIRAFLRYLQTSETRWAPRETPHAPSERAVTSATVRTYHRRLGRFYNWLVDQEEMPASPVTKVPRTRTKDREEKPDPFSDEEIEQILTTVRHAGDSELAERDRAIVAVLLDVGLRASELAALQVSDVDMLTGDLTVVGGKGDKDRRMRLGVRARRQVRRYWIKHRQRHGATGALFLSAKGKPMDRNGVFLIAERIGRQAGVAHCHPHRFRHTFAITALRAGMGELQLQHMLGHTKLDMTERYVKLADADTLSASRAHSPLDHLKFNL